MSEVREERERGTSRGAAPTLSSMRPEGSSGVTAKVTGGVATTVILSSVMA